MAVPCVLAVVNSLTVDGSRYLPYLVDTSLYFFKQNTPEASDTVHSLLKHLVNHCSDGEAITSFMELLLHEMDAARCTPAVKKQVYLGLQAVLQGMNERGMGKAACHASATKIENLLITALKKESNPAAKGCLLDCISHAILLSETYSEELLTTLSGSLQATNTTLLSSLYCLSSVLRVSTAVTKPEVLKKGLEEAVGRAMAKPFICGREGVLAFPSLIRLAILLNEPMPPVLKESLKEGSYLYQPSMYVSSNREDDLLVSWCNEALYTGAELLLTSHCLHPDEETALLKLVFSQIVLLYVSIHV